MQMTSLQQKSKSLHFHSKMKLCLLYMVSVLLVRTFCEFRSVDGFKLSKQELISIRRLAKHNTFYRSETKLFQATDKSDNANLDEKLFMKWIPKVAKTHIDLRPFNLNRKIQTNSQITIISFYQIVFKLNGRPRNKEQSLCESWELKFCRNSVKEERISKQDLI